MIYKIKRGCSPEAATQATTWTQAPDLERRLFQWLTTQANVLKLEMTQRNRQLESTCSVHAWKDRVSHSERGGVMWFRREVSQSAELGIWSSLSQLSADREAKETYIAAAQISEASHTAAAAGTVCHSQHGGQHTSRTQCAAFGGDTKGTHCGRHSDIAFHTSDFHSLYICGCVSHTSQRDSGCMCLS